MKNALMAILALILLDCSQDSVTTMTDLNGNWVDMSTKTDTLTFGSFGDQAYLILARGKEIINGNLLPKYGSGPYHYKLLTGDSISLHWTLSSNSNFANFYFKQTGDRITIIPF